MIYLRWSWTNFLKILCFCLIKIIFVGGDRSSLLDLMCKDLAMVTEPHPSIPLEMAFHWGKFSLAILDRRR